MKSEDLTKELKLGFGNIGVTSFIALVFNFAFLVFQLNNLGKISHRSSYLVYIGGNIISSMLLALICFAFLYLSGKIEKIEKSKENSIFSTATIIAVVLIFLNVGIFLTQFFIIFTDLLSIIFSTFYIILQLCLIFVYIFFVLSIKKMNCIMEFGLIMWPIVIYAIVNSIEVILRMIIQVLMILNISPYLIYTNIFYSIFQFIGLAVELVFIISMFLVANKAQISSLHQVSQYVPYSHSLNEDKSKQSTNYCPFCGTKNSPDSKFCINCGKKID